MTHGILALQGDYYAHGRVYDKLGLKYLYVKKPDELERVDTLVIPGGESTTIRKLARSIGLWDMLKEFDRPMMGTCTGIILMAHEIENDDEETLDHLDITVSRNAYGSQINSATQTGIYLPDNNEIEMVFIRAPRIIETGDRADVIARYQGETVAVRQGNKIGLTFHPELSDISLFHKILTDI